MKLICLDLEGVLVPEIWIAFANATGIPEFRRTTRDEPDYDKLMHYRIELLKKHHLKLPDIQNVIAGMDPLPGAIKFANAICEKSQLVILSDTFDQFAKPLMKKLNWPTLFCNTLKVDSDGFICGYSLRQQNGKREAVKAFKTMNIKVFAAGDSFNDLAMIREADAGCLFCAPENIIRDNSDLRNIDSYNEFFHLIEEFLS